MANAIQSRNYIPLIFELRGVFVMLDADLAVLYGVETKRLKEQVRRNLRRFPADFMFELTREETERLRSQIATSKRGGTRYAPMAFTEQGVAMLSSVLTSERAILVNIEIMRAFSKYRSLLRENEDLKKEIHDLDQKLNRIFRYLLDKIDAMHQRNASRTPVGFRIKNK